MPLRSGSSRADFEANLKTELAAGKPEAQALAIAYAKKRGDEGQFQSLGSVRKIDVDGKLHVELTHISKANICPYYGREIPDSEALRLEPDRLYRLWRHPDELARAAESANRLPVQDEHIAFLAADPPTDNVVGATGESATFNAPYLDNSMVIWVKESIDGVESGEQRELSCSYRYRAEMTPGVYDGLPYDGIMRDIVFNHVALVREGRAGSDVLVADEKGTSMALKSRRALVLQGALAAAVRPFLTSDVRTPWDPILGDVTNKNFKAKRTSILARVVSAFDGKLNDSFDPKVLTLAFDAAEKEEAEDEAEAMDKRARDMKRAKDRKEAWDAMCAADGEEESEEEREDREAKDKAEDARRARDGEEEETEAERAERYTKDRKAAKDKRARDKRRGKDAEGEAEKEREEERAEDRRANDARIAKAVKQAKEETRTEVLAHIRSVDEARRLVAPHIGEVDLAMDSAEDILKLALDGLPGVSLDGTESLSALKNMVAMLREPGSAPSALTLAADSRAANDVSTMFPQLRRIRQG